MCQREQEDGTLVCRMVEENKKEEKWSFGEGGMGIAN